MKLSDENFFFVMKNYILYGTIPNEIKGTWKQSNLKRTAKSYYMFNEKLYEVTKKPVYQVEQDGERIENVKVKKVGDSYEKDVNKDILVVHFQELNHLIKNYHLETNHCGEMKLRMRFQNYKCYGG